MLVYLGQVISADGVQPCPDKLREIAEAEPPKDVQVLQAYLGMINFYRKHVSNMSTLLYPLYKLLKKNVRWQWTSVEADAFEQSKMKLQEARLFITTQREN